MIKSAIRSILFAKKKSLILPPPTVVMTSNTAPAPFVVSASSVFDMVAYAAWQAYDGSAVDGGNSGLWASADSSPASIIIDYGATYAFSTVEITGRVSGSEDQNPRAFDLQASNDGITFTTFASYSGLSWTGSETKTFTFAPVTARHLRIFVTLAGVVTSIVLVNWK